MDCWEFSHKVLEHVPRATYRERRDIEWELRDHVMDSAQMLEEGGCPSRDSVGKAVERMGDPAEIGRALNAQFSPFWLWMGRACLILAAAVCVLLLSNWDGLCRLGQNVVARTVPGLLLEKINWQVNATVEVRENGESRYYTFPAGSPEAAGYTQSAGCDLRLEIGDQVIRVFRIYGDPATRRVGVALVEYSRDPHGYNRRLGWESELFSQRGEGSGSIPIPVVVGEYTYYDADGSPSVEASGASGRVNVVFQWRGADCTLADVQDIKWCSDGRSGDSGEGAGVHMLLELPVEPGDTYIVLTCEGKELVIPLPWEVKE